MRGKKKLVIGNWKMNPETLTEAKKLFGSIKRKAPKYKKVATIVCPPFVFLHPLSKSYSGKAVVIGAQDLYPEKKGAFTGEIGPLQLRDAGCSHVIIGHSERRAGGETDADVARKIRAALDAKLTPIVCIGESERDSQGKYLMFLREQITRALAEAKNTEIAKIIIAYEPIWAIGKTGRDAITPQKLHETTLFIRRVLLESYSKKIGMEVCIIYGGSVKPENAEDLLCEGNVMGFLVGGASLRADSFTEIIEIANGI